MPRWSAERRIVPIARDVGRLETRPGVRRARSGASQAPSAISALRSPSLGREGFSQSYGAPGAAKQTGGGALAMTTSSLLRDDPARPSPPASPREAGRALAQK